MIGGMRLGLFCQVERRMYNCNIYTILSSLIIWLLSIIDQPLQIRGDEVLVYAVRGVHHIDTAATESGATCY